MATKAYKAQADKLRVFIKGADITNTAHRAALGRALLYLYARQTADEQQTETTNVTNGQGFTGFDAEFMSSVAKGVQRYGNMTEKQAKHVQRKLVKYAGQLIGLHNDHIAK